MRRKSRTDATQAAIVRALKAAGCTVLDLSGVAGGVPDLLVARAGQMFLIECKSPPGPRGGTSAKGQRLNGLQEMWRAGWRAPVGVVCGPYEALRYVGSIGAESPPAGKDGTLAGGPSGSGLDAPKS